MRRALQLADIERLLGGKCGVDGDYFAQQFPDGVDLGTAAGKTVARQMHQGGLAVEFGLAIVLDEPSEKLAFIAETIRLRKELLGATTQEDVAEVAMEEGERREVARGILLEFGSEGRHGHEVTQAYNRTLKAGLALGGPEGMTQASENMYAWAKAAGIV